MSDDKTFGFKSAYDEGQESKFIAKAKANPFVPAGIFGAVSALLYSAYKFRNRGDQKVSVYLIHTRVAAQGAVVAALTIGVGIQMYREYFLGESPQSLMKAAPKKDE
ncbi:HIG1 domain family member 1A, mitochondrial [Orchesella cincta]|uniref:HIG1 domain family member 1A, mitochondrial n=1 Tax=Orchesella cincta TaxID=48709 RepID=A0A1D2NEJ2_ORCCI|nr:HIG1 domain family member 1A, mitochondrial [Orchesella cincta]